MQVATKAPQCVVRYDKRVYVERFFNTGELRLAPLQAFGSSAVAEPMRDAQEGRGYVSFDHATGRFRGLFATSPKMLVLCCSTVDSADHAKLLKGSDAAGIRIENVERFARKIAGSLEGCVHWEHRACDYSGRVTSTPPAGLQNAIDLCDATMKDDPEAAMRGIWDFTVNGGMGTRWCYAKEPHHAHEQEYRFVWFFDRDIRHPVVHEFPHARRACRSAWVQTVVG